MSAEGAQADTGKRTALPPSPPQCVKTQQVAVASAKLLLLPCRSLGEPRVGPTSEWKQMPCGLGRGHSRGPGIGAHSPLCSQSSDRDKAGLTLTLASQSEPRGLPS